MGKFRKGLTVFFLSVAILCNVRCSVDQKYPWPSKILVSSVETADSLGKKKFCQNLISQTVTINGINGTGSGFIFGKGNGKTYVLTCYHVIANEGMARQKVVDNNVFILPLVVGYVPKDYDFSGKKSLSNKSAFGMVTKVFPDRDLAIITINEEINVDPVIFNKSFYIGEKVYACGNPGGYSWTLTEGIVSKTANIFSNDAFITDISIGPGSSGCPVFNHRGEVVGMIQRKVLGYELGLALDSHEILEIFGK